MGLTQNLGLLSTAIKATSTLNVGLGTSSPSSKLSIFESSGTTTSTFELSTTGNTMKSRLGMFANNFYIASNWFFNGSANVDTTSNGISTIEFNSNGSSIFYNSPAGSTNPIERLRITSGGNVQVQGPVYRYSGTTTIGGSFVNLTALDMSSSRTYLIQIIPTNVEASVAYRIFGVIQANATSATYTFVSLASQTMDITFSGTTVQARVVNGQQWNFNWSITQLL